MKKCLLHKFVVVNYNGLHFIRGQKFGNARCWSAREHELQFCSLYIAEFDTYSLKSWRFRIRPPKRVLRNVARFSVQITISEVHLSNL